MCKALGPGKNCKDLPSNSHKHEDEDDKEDLESVVTENSSIVGEGSEVNEESLTPPLSDGELTPTEDNYSDNAADEAILRLASMRIQDNNLH